MTKEERLIIAVDKILKDVPVDRQPQFIEVIRQILKDEGYKK